MAMVITYFMGQGWPICNMLEVFKQLRWAFQSGSLSCVWLAQRLLGNPKLLCGTEQVATAANADTTQMPWDLAAKAAQTCSSTGPQVSRPHVPPCGDFRMKPVGLARLATSVM